MRAATGDRREVQRILTNLLGNALKFTPEGGHVELAGWFDGSWALLAVRDDGPGVAPDDRTRIFERFYRVDAQAAVSGTGPRAGDRPRPRPGDGRRARRGVRPGLRLELRADPARSGPGRRRDDRRRPRPGAGRRGGPPRGGCRPPGDPVGRPAGRAGAAGSAIRTRRRPSRCRPASPSGCGRSTARCRGSIHRIPPEPTASADVAERPTYPRTWTDRRGSWITALTCGRRSRSVRLPHDMAGPQGNVTREGRRETGAGTGRAAEDRSDPRGGPAQVDAGSGSRPVHRPHDAGGPWTALANRSRRASRACPSCRPTALAELDRGLAAPRPDRPAGRLHGRSWSTTCACSRPGTRRST